MKRRVKSVKKSNALYKKGLRTNVRNVHKNPSRGGIRL
jgi:hypothetical protein